jgi:SNF2 family DNA or RNA helicase
MLRRDQLHGYQRMMESKSKTTPHMGLFMDMGLGKTATMLTILVEIKGKTLLIAPKAVAKNVWRQEAKKWEHTSEMKFALLVGTPQERLAALRSNADIYLINPENVPWLFEQKTLPSWDNLVVDESSRFKNPSSKRWKSLKNSLKTFLHRYILTGTPTPKSYLDLWTQLGILDLGQRLGKSMTSYKDRFFLPDARDRRTGVVWSWKLKPGAKEEIDSLVGDICFSLRAEDFLSMPQRQDIYHKIEWDKKGRALYNQLKKDMVVEIGDADITAPSAGTLSGKLLQMCSGSVYDEFKNVLPVHEEKINYIQDLLDDDTPTLIFYNFHHSLAKLQAAFPDAKVLDPDDDMMQGQWRQGKITRLLCHPKSVGIGLNLQCNVGATAQIIWFDITWNSEDFLQANARLFRQGQTKPVVLHYLLMENSMDEQAMSVCEGKVSVQEALMNALKIK